MQPKTSVSRRMALTALTTASAAALLSETAANASPEPAPSQSPRGRLKQSVSYWCFDKLSLSALCRAAKDMGILGIDLLGEKEWPTVREHGLVCAMANGPGNIEDGWNRIENHGRLITATEALLPKVAAAGIRNVVVFSGNRRGMSDAEGIANCAKGLEQVLPLAQSLDIVLCMELLNSKRDHRDYQCDRTAWGAALAAQLKSPHFKLLYDIYHMQIMEGDIIASIGEHIDHIAHFHTGGVPGRNEIDHTQELNYRRICQAIADTGFDGFLAHEFIPTAADPLESLRAAVALCAV